MLVTISGATSPKSFGLPVLRPPPPGGDAHAQRLHLFPKVLPDRRIHLSAQLAAMSWAQLAESHVHF